LFSFEIGQSALLDNFLAAHAPAYRDAHKIIKDVDTCPTSEEYDLFSVEVKSPKKPESLAAVSAVLLEALQVQFLRRHVTIEPVHFMASYFPAPETKLNLTFTNFPRKEET